MMAFIFVLAAGSFIAWIVLNGASQDRKKRQEIQNKKEALALVHNFRASVGYGGLFGENGIALDTETEKLAIVNSEVAKVFDFSQIIAVEAIKDNSSIVRVNRGSQAIGAAVGAAILGPAGMLMGGLSASKSSTMRIGRLAIKIYTSNLIDPVHEVVFFKSASPTDLPAASRWIQDMDKWYGRIKAIIHMGDKVTS